MRDGAIKSPRVLHIQSNLCVSVMRLFWDQVCALQGYEAMPYQGFSGICYLYIQRKKKLFCSEGGGSRFLRNVGSYSLYDVTTRRPKSWYSPSQGHQISQDSYTLLKALVYWLGSSFEARGTWLKSHSGNLPSRYFSVRPTQHVMLTTHVQSGPTCGALPPLSVVHKVNIIARISFLESCKLCLLLRKSPWYDDKHPANRKKRPRVGTAFPFSGTISTAAHLRGVSITALPRHIKTWMKSGDYSTFAYILRSGVRWDAELSWLKLYPWCALSTEHLLLSRQILVGICWST
jgi:hypothetical protein